MILSWPTQTPGFFHLLFRNFDWWLGCIWKTMPPRFISYTNIPDMILQHMPTYISHRIHVCYIYGNIGGILMGSMLPYIAAPWIRHGIYHITKSQIIDYPPEKTRPWKFLDVNLNQRSSCQRHRWSVFWETFCGCSPDHIIQGQSQWFFPVEISKMTTRRSTENLSVYD